MPFLLLFLGLFLPRIAIAILWFFTSWFPSVFDGLVIPILGFLLLPYTLLWYGVVEGWYGGNWGTMQLLILVVAVIFDLGSWFGSRPRGKG